MRRLSLLVVAGAVAATTVVSGGAVAAPAQPAPAARPAPAAAPAAPKAGANYQPPAIRWTACTEPRLAQRNLQCGTLVVPLDYDRPRGPKIRIAVTRLPRDAKLPNQGVMLVNPGGPGGSGLTLPVLGRGDIIPGDGDRQYDWIGFDPRGVGNSVPALTCDGAYNGYDRPNYVPTTDALERAWLRKAAGYSAACRYSDGRRLLNHMKTRDVVADMDNLRKALGQRQINFYGFSYGTYLAQVYATQYPNRVRRFVLDGNVNPSRVWYQANLDQDLAFEKSIKVWFAWLAKYNDVFGLGDNADIVEATYYRQLDELDATPALGVIGPDELNDVLLSAGYYVYDWVGLGEAFAALVNENDATQIKAYYDAANPQTPGSDNGYAVYLGVQCTDAPWPRRWSRWRTDNWRIYAQARFVTWGNAWFNAPCLTWPAKAGRPVDVDGSKVKSKILLVNETLDGATPYSGALEVRRRFPTASLIEGVGGTTHSGSLSGIACTDDAIGTYLTNGTVPTRRAGDRSDLECPPVPQPDPTAAAQRRSGNAAEQDRQIVRDALEAAQRHTR